MHRSIQAILDHFDTSHLPDELAAVAAPFGELAHKVGSELGLEGPEVTASLRKLLEAQDCALRAARRRRPPKSADAEAKR